MVEKCSLGHPFQQWMIAFAQTNGFKEPTPQMLEMVAAFSQTWCQSRINELGNKWLRDSEHRINASKVILVLWVQNVARPAPHSLPICSFAEVYCRGSIPQVSTKLDLTWSWLGVFNGPQL